jgi:hypothetical protein
LSHGYPRKTPLPPKTSFQLVCSFLLQIPHLRIKPIHTANSSGECVLSQSASAAFRRDCQRGPVARNASSTSLSRRTVVGVLVLPSGLPRRTTFPPLRSSAPAIQSSVISGASSGSTQVLGELFSFAVICLSHAYDAAIRAAGRPDQHDNPAMQPARSRESLFPIIEAQVWLRQRHARKNLGNKLKIHSALNEGFIALHPVVKNSHAIIVLTLIRKRCHFLLVQKNKFIAIKKPASSPMRVFLFRQIRNAGCRAYEAPLKTAIYCAAADAGMLAPFFARGLRGFFLCSTTGGE